MKKLRPSEELTLQENLRFINCSHLVYKKNGVTKQGKERYVCCVCRKGWTGDGAKSRENKYAKPLLLLPAIKKGLSYAVIKDMYGVGHNTIWRAKKLIKELENGRFLS